MAEAGGHLEEERDTDTLLISSDDSLDEPIIGTMGIEEEDSFSNRREESGQKENGSEDEGEGAIAARAHSQTDGKERGEESKTQEDQGGRVPSIEFVPIHFSDGTVVIFNVHGPRVLVVVEFVDAVEGLRNGGVSLENMIAISAVSGAIQPQSMLMDRVVFSQIDHLPTGSENGCYAETHSNENE